MPSASPSPTTVKTSASFANLTRSSLAGVFGSEVSLAELTGDVATPTATPFRLRTSDLSNSGLTSSSSNSPTPDRNGRSSAHQRTNSQTVPSISDAVRAVPLSSLAVVIRFSILFAFGVGYGQFTRHLHDNHQITSSTLDIDKTGVFSLLWGFQGVTLGFLLPFFDWLYPEKRRWYRGKGGYDWASIIRAVAAFVGVAYGIGKLSWTSTLQAAAFWGLVNPCLWFLLDATRNGFILSSLTAIVGTGVFAIMFPDHLPKAAWSETYASVFTWLASVFFCCSICFGNLGRRLLSFDRHQGTR
jgi:hypothetical protein